MDSYELAFDGRSAKAVLSAREQRDGAVLWGIFDGPTCLTEPGTWEWESSPSSRTEDYLQRARRPLEGALDLWRDHLVAACGGGTWGDGIVGNVAARDCLRVYDPEGIAARAGDPVDRPRKGKWIGAPCVHAYGVTDGTPAEVAVEIDHAFRTGIALLAYRWRVAGSRGGRIGTPAGFDPAVVAGMPGHLRDPGVLRPLARDLAAHLADGRGFRVGDALLLASGEAMVARIEAPPAERARQGSVPSTG